MWIQDVDKSLINLDMTATIEIGEKNPWDDNNHDYVVKAYTPSATIEHSVIHNWLFIGDKDECKAFLERLTALLGDKVLKI